MARKREPTPEVEVAERSVTWRYGMLERNLEAIGEGDGEFVGIDYPFDTDATDIVELCAKAAKRHGIETGNIFQLYARFEEFLARGWPCTPEEIEHGCELLIRLKPPGGYESRAHPVAMANEILCKLATLKVQLRKAVGACGNPGEIECIAEQLLGIGFAAGRLEAALDWQEHASTGEAVREGAAAGGRARPETSHQERVRMWREVWREVGSCAPDGTPHWGAVTRAAKAVAKRRGSSSWETERRFFNRYREEIVALD